jgi:acyl-[acyl-carrier-protein]-phospholipid O-acyltransferase/long-chain-fatty-acid--[acyl-carrier-protein] ligase
LLLHQLFIQTAKRHGKKPAIVDRTSNLRLTYKQALIGCLILARKFRGIESMHIGIMLPNSAGAVLSVLATLMSGHVPVMINYSTGAAKNCAYARAKCPITTIVTSKVLLQKIGCAHVPATLYLEDILASVSLFAKVTSFIVAAMPLWFLLKRCAGRGEEDTALVLFTSGSEKDPKGVPLTHRNIHSNCRSLCKAFAFSPEDVFLGNLPYFHIFGQTANLWVPVLQGCTIVTYANPLDFKTMCDIIREAHVTVMCGTPMLYWGYLRASQDGDFESVRIMLSGADTCPDGLRDGFMRKHGTVLLEAYGATETSPAITVNTHEANRPGSVGRPIDGVEVKIVNESSGVPCCAGETGRILVKGPNVMKGYINDASETAASFREGWYDTGDMGYFDSGGYLWHTGRVKRFLKVAGEMISLANVESALEHLLPPDVECCVVDIPDDVRGGRIVAAVSHPVDRASIVRELSQQLPNIALPERFVVLPEMPKTASGKTDFRAITEAVRSIIAARSPVDAMNQ